jgi:hypothetical protein
MKNEERCGDTRKQVLYFFVHISSNLTINWNKKVGKDDRVLKVKSMEPIEALKHIIGPETSKRYSFETLLKLLKIKSENYFSAL